MRNAKRRVIVGAPMKRRPAREPGRREGGRGKAEESESRRERERGGREGGRKRAERTQWEFHAGGREGGGKGGGKGLTEDNSHAVALQRQGPPPGLLLVLNSDPHTGLSTDGIQSWAFAISDR